MTGRIFESFPQTSALPVRAIRLGIKARIFSGGTPDKSNITYWQGGNLPWIGSGEVNQGVIISPTAHITESAVRGSATKLFPKGSIAMALAGQGKTKATVATMGIHAYGNQSLACISDFQGNSRFLYWWLVCLYKEIRGLSSQETRDGLNQSMVGQIPVPDYSHENQWAIADFLDRETARIDQLIEKKERLVETTEAEFLSRTTLAVTLGLNPDIPTKPSGYAWHPRIPEGWTATCLKFLCARIVDCLHETPEHDGDGEYSSIRTADVSRGKLTIETAKRVSAAEYRNRIQRLEPEAGDVLYTREGERFGLAALVPKGTKLCLGQRMMMFRVNRRVTPDYLMWSLNGGFAYQYLKQRTAGSTSPHLNIFDIRNVPIFLPPLEEQREIHGELNKRFETKERMLDLVGRTIDCLRELRAGLITAAVTGQVDVTTWGQRGHTDRRLDVIEREMAS